MSIISIIKDFHLLLASLISGEGIDVIFPGAFFVTIGAVCIIVQTAFGIHRKCKGIKISLSIMCSLLYLYYFTLKHLPIDFVKSNIEFSKRDGMLFGQFWYPFYQMSALKITDIINIYISDFIFMLAFAFLATLCFKPLVKFSRFIILDVSIVLFEIVFVLVNNVCHGGVYETYDLGCAIIDVPAMLVGWLLAIVVIKLNKGLYEKLQAKKEKTKISENII